MVTSMVEKRIALVIGNNYPNSKNELHYSIADAIKIKEILENKNICAFDNVTLLVNKTSRDTLTELDILFTNTHQDDLIFIYFSGHGKKDSQNNLYLLFEDTNEKLLKSSAISFDFIDGCLKSSNVKWASVVIVLDCCYSAAAGTKGTEDIEEKLASYCTRGTVILTSTGSTQSPTAMESEELGHSFFTYYLIEGLEKGHADKDGDGLISIDEWYDYAFKKTTESCSQSPMKKGSIEGNIFIGMNLSKIKEKEYELKKKKLLNELSDQLPLDIFGECQAILRKYYQTPSILQKGDKVVLGYLESLLMDNLLPEKRDDTIQNCIEAVQHLKEKEALEIKQQEEFRKQREEEERKKKEKKNPRRVNSNCKDPNEALEIKQREELRKQREEEEKKKKEIKQREELCKQREEEERKKKEKEALEIKQREELRKQREEEERKKKEKEALEIKKQEELRKQREEEEREKKEKEALEIKKQEELRKQREEEERKKKEKEALEIKQREELRKQREEEEREKKEKEALEIKKQEELRKQREEEERKKKEIKQREELRKQREEEERKKKEKEALEIKQQEDLKTSTSKNIAEDSNAYIKLEPRNFSSKDHVIIRSDTKASLSQIHQCIFNPDIFANYEATLDKKGKLRLLLRLSSYSYIILIFIVLTIGIISSIFSKIPFSSNTFSFFIIYLFVCLLFTIPIGIVATFITGIAFRIGGGAVGGLVLGIVLSTFISLAHNMALDDNIGIGGAMAFGIDLGMSFGMALGIIRGINLGIDLGIIFGIAGGIAGIISGSIGLGITFGITFSIALIIALKTLVDTDFTINQCIAFFIIGGLASSTALGIAGGIAESISFFVFCLGFMQLRYKKYFF